MKGLEPTSMKIARGPNDEGLKKKVCQGTERKKEEGTRNVM